MATDLFIHVGASKSGTSSLQVGLRSSQDALAAAGLGLPFVGRTERATRILRPLGWEVVQGFPRPVDEDRLDRTARDLSRFPGERLLLTIEDLAELDESRIDALLGRLDDQPGLRVHVIVTIRDWSRTLPSEWQQQLKRRMTTDYPSYLAQVRDDEGPDARLFRQRQDVAGICSRWATKVPAERIHVIPLGGPTQDGDSIFRAVAGVVGVDHALITRPQGSVNRSYGYLECEVLRRLNVSLGSRLGNIRTQYNPGVRRVLASGALGRGSAHRVTLPPEHLGWVQAEMSRQVGVLRGLGVDEVEDLDQLVPDEGAARPLPVLDEAELAQAAVDTLAAFATKTFKQRRELEKELRMVRRRTGAAERRASGSAGAGSSRVRRARAVVGRVRRGVRRRWGTDK